MWDSHHLPKANCGYLRHFVIAMRFNFLALAILLTGLVHAFVPWVFPFLPYRLAKKIVQDTERYFIHDMNANNWQIVLADGFELQSSGTTGVPKSIYQPPSKLQAANKVALVAQNITQHSRILTVCRTTHAGGLLAQTLPAWSIGAHVEIKSFNAYSFGRDIEGYTHTHLTPAHCQLLMQTKNFQALDLRGVFVTCGSDNVGFDIIEAFVARGAIFMCNWGMTEIGPITINTVFDSLAKVETYRKQAVAQATLMGDSYFCEYKIQNDELWVKADSCVYPGWFNTHDRVVLNAQGAMYHLGRNE